METNWVIFDGDNGIAAVFDEDLNKSKKHQRDDALVPFKTKVDKNRYEDFSGVVGAFSRLLAGTGVKVDLDRESLYETMKGKLEDTSDDDFDKLFTIVEDLFFADGKLLPINVKSLNYIDSNISQQQVAEYLYSLFIEPNGLKERYEQMAGLEDINIMENLLFDSLADNEQKESVIQEADCFLPYVNDSFVKDFKSLTENTEFYRTYIKRFLAYYYMFYVSQLAVKLGKFEKGNRDELEKIYMTLTWEVVTRVRLGYEYGWKYVKDRLSHMFSHSVLFELLKHNVEEKHLDYIGYYERFNGTGEDKIVASEIEKITEMYRNWIPMNYPAINEDKDETNCLTSKALRDLFDTIDYQFINGGRKSHYNGYNKKYIDFVQKNFGKFRGTVGYTLSVNENDIIMFTKIILKQYDGRVRLSVLFKEFEKRGLLFDRESKKLITELFEKMDLLEKRSDSGDAQYVKYLL